MKKKYPIYNVADIISYSFSQQTNPSKPFAREDYLKRRKPQTTVGWGDAWRSCCNDNDRICNIK